MSEKKEVRNLNRICPICFMTLEPKGSCFFCSVHSSDVKNPSLTLPTRSVLGKRYFVGKLLGEGGFGITYKAWDLDLSKAVAIKEFFPKGYTDRNSTLGIVPASEHEKAFRHWLGAFIKEANILAETNQLRGVVRISDFFQENGTAYIVTDFLDGVSLRTHMNMMGGRIHWRDALAMMKPVLESLHALHLKEIIHNDISPENIMIVKNIVVKLIDFGAATSYNNPIERPYIVLKPGFSPIESYSAKAKKGPYTDIYQIAATLYNMITGVILPEAINRDKKQITPPSKMGIEVPPIVENTLLKALNVAAEARYQTIQHFSQYLFGGVLS